MLERSGDLIPVKPDAVHIPWTKRKSLVLNFLHRGPVSFDTYVYDTNVGDVSQLSAYFNPERWSVVDLNKRFGIQPQDNKPTEQVSDSEDSKSGEKVLVPKLLIYPEKQESEEQTRLSPSQSVTRSQTVTPSQSVTPEARETSTSPIGSNRSRSSSQDELGLRGFEDSLFDSFKQDTVQSCIGQQLCHPLNESAMRRALLDLSSEYHHQYYPLQMSLYNYGSNSLTSNSLTSNSLASTVNNSSSFGDPFELSLNSSLARNLSWLLNDSSSANVF